jgi:hypothetical protein
MTKAELESKHLAELHTLAADAGVPRYRMLARGELIDALATSEGDSPKPSASPRSPRRERSRATRGESTRPREESTPPREQSPAPAASEEEPAAKRPRRRRRRRFGRKGGGVREHANRWLEAWNSHDLEAVVACYAEDVEFVMPDLVGDAPEQRFSGRDELRTHFRHGLELAPNLAVTEESVLVGPGGFAILYKREDGHRAIETVELNDAGLVKRARVYYEREQS